jgi:hypothetical protein
MQLLHFLQQLSPGRNLLLLQHASCLLHRLLLCCTEI